MSANKTLDTIKSSAVRHGGALGYKVFPVGETIMVKHGALSKSHVYKLLRSKDARVRRAAFTLLETSNPKLRRNSELFIAITRFIWDANPSYEVYREFTKRHFQARYKVHELIGARLKMENQKKQRAAEDHVTDDARHREGGFFTRLFGRRGAWVSRFARPALVLRRTKTAAITPSSAANSPWAASMRCAARPRMFSGSGRSPAFLARPRTCAWMATRRRASRQRLSSARAGGRGWHGQS